MADQSKKPRLAGYSTMGHPDADAFHSFMMKDLDGDEAPLRPPVRRCGVS